MPSLWYYYFVLLNLDMIKMDRIRNNDNKKKKKLFLEYQCRIVDRTVILFLTILLHSVNTRGASVPAVMECKQ